jgi:DNA-binding transcriptional LysR family regulator
LFWPQAGEALLAAALAGQGLINEPTFIIGDGVRSGRLVALVLDHCPVEMPGVFAVYPSNRRPPAKVRALVDFLVKRLGPAPWDRNLDVDVVQNS